MATATAATASTAAAAAATAPLNAVADKYEGVIVDPSSLPETTADFVSSLDASLAAWRLQGVRGVWLKLPATTAHPARHWVGHALDAGFRLHHAERDYVMLTHWLPGGEDRLPPNASTQCGIGAFVLNDKREILVVQEASGPLRGAGVWKMPTGLVQVGERQPACNVRYGGTVARSMARFDGLPSSLIASYPPDAALALSISPSAARRGHQRRCGARDI